MQLDIAPLRCKNCSSELPIRGQFITFQCPSCRKHWVLGDDDLEPLTVERATSVSLGGEIIYIPFWVVRIDMRSVIEVFKNELRRTTVKVSTTMEKLKSPDGSTQKEADHENFLTLNNSTEEKLFTKKGELITHVAAGGISISRSELNNFINALSSKKNFRVFVPAFLSYNPYAYIKVGRLMTAHQIEYESKKSSSESTVLCSLRKSSALNLVDFIFISTLPEKLKMAGRLVERLHLKTIAECPLVEFPFRLDGSYLKSIHGGFSISKKLISLTTETVRV